MPNEPLPSFDQFGILTGNEGDAFWRGIVTELFVRIAPHGWDQPHELWTVLTPLKTAAVQLEGEIPEFAIGKRPDSKPEDAITIEYGLEHLLTLDTHPRADLPGIYAPEGCAALMLVNEAWSTFAPIPAEEEADVVAGLLGTGTTFDGDAPSTEREQRAESLARGKIGKEMRPSESPDRVELRQAFIMEPDGSCRMYSHTRGDDVTDPSALRSLVGGGESERLIGVIPDLLSRCFRLPVDPPCSVGEILGRVALLSVAQMMEQNPTRMADPGAILFGTLLNAARLIDGLDTAFDAQDTAPELAPIFGQGSLTEAVTEMAQHATFGPLMKAGRQLANEGWEGFFARPGAARWIRRDDHDRFLTPELREWYGTGHLARFVDERLPEWGYAYQPLEAAIGRPTAGMVVALLHDLGWHYTER